MSTAIVNSDLFGTGREWRWPVWFLVTLDSAQQFHCFVRNCRWYSGHPSRHVTRRFRWQNSSNWVTSTSACTGNSVRRGTLKSRTSDELWKPEFPLAYSNGYVNNLYTASMQYTYNALKQNPLYLSCDKIFIFATFGWAVWDTKARKQHSSRRNFAEMTFLTTVQKSKSQYNIHT